VFLRLSVSSHLDERYAASAARRRIA